MTAVATTIDGLSTTAANNGPAGTDAVGTTLDDNLRTMQAVVRLLASANSISSASTTDLSTVNDTFITVSGTTTITALGTLTSGVYKWLIFSGALTLTHNGTSLILPTAANITTAAGDCGLFLSLGAGNWRCLTFIRAATGAFSKQPTRQVLISGTAATYTTPSTATRINVRAVGGSSGGVGASASSAATGSTFVGTGVNMSAGGGPGGVQANNNVPTAAAASGGDINIPGGLAAIANNSAGVNSGTAGAASVFGGQGGGGSGSGTGSLVGGAAGTNSGSGGGGGGASGAAPGSGGNAGAYCEKLILAPAATFTYTVGAKSSGTAGNGNTAAGGDGAAGIIIVDEYYN